MIYHDTAGHKRLNESDWLYDCLQRDASTDYRGIQPYAVEAAVYRLDPPLRNKLDGQIHLVLNERISLLECRLRPRVL